jgi:hypothetical protein
MSLTYPALVVYRLAVCLATLAQGCSKSSAPVGPRSDVVLRGQTPDVASPPDSRATIGRELGLTFPPGTRLLGVAREQGIDDLVELKVEMKAADVESFVAHSAVRPTDFRPGERGLFGPDQGWWDPNRALRLRSAQANLPKGRFLNIGVADGSGDMAVVYIVNHGT